MAAAPAPARACAPARAQRQLQYHHVSRDLLQVKKELQLSTAEQPVEEKAAENTVQKLAVEPQAEEGKKSSIKIVSQKKKGLLLRCLRRAARRRRAASAQPVAASVRRAARAPSARAATSPVASPHHLCAGANGRWAQVQARSARARRSGRAGRTSGTAPARGGGLACRSADPPHLDGVVGSWGSAACGMYLRVCSDLSGKLSVEVHISAPISGSPDGLK